MSRRLVTPVDNFVDNGDGTWEQKDDSIFGFLEKTHFIQAQMQYPETGIIQIGTLVKLEISWAHARVPAVDLLAPEEVAFIGFENEIVADEEEEEESDDFYSYDELDADSVLT